MNGRQDWRHLILVGLIGAAVGATGVFALTDAGGEAELIGTPPNQRPSLRFAAPPPPAWVDIRGACAELEPLVERYGEPGRDGAPFDEGEWIYDLLNLTEWMGSTGYEHIGNSASFTPQESGVASGAGLLRIVTISGGLSDPTFPLHLADLMDRCETLAASSPGKS